MIYISVSLLIYLSFYPSISSEPSSIEVGVHVNNVVSRDGAQILSVAEVIIHGDYNSQTAYNNDIALIKVDEDIVFSNEIQPVCLPEADNLYIHRKSVIAGWGISKYRLHSVSHS